MNENVDFIKQLQKDPMQADLLEVFQEKYMHIRFEDAASNPMHYASIIYNFVGHPLHPAVIDWVNKISDAQQQEPPRTRGVLDWFFRTPEKKEPKLTMRSPKKAIHAWRKNITFHGSSIIQDICRRSMIYWGYKFFTSKSELIDLKIPSFKLVENYFI